ncbi:hypothetical protein SRHO_G00268690 [Serrasalmus rhombeus]
MVVLSPPFLPYGCVLYAGGPPPPLCILNSVSAMFSTAGPSEGHQDPRASSPLTSALISNMSYHSDRWWQSKRFLG